MQHYEISKEHYPITYGVVGSEYRLVILYAHEQDDEALYINVVVSAESYIRGVKDYDEFTGGQTIARVITWPPIIGVIGSDLDTYPSTTEGVVPEEYLRIAAEIEGMLAADIAEGVWWAPPELSTLVRLGDLKEGQKFEHLGKKLERGSTNKESLNGPIAVSEIGKGFEGHCYTPDTLVQPVGRPPSTKGKVRLDTMLLGTKFKCQGVEYERCLSEGEDVRSGTPAQNLIGYVCRTTVFGSLAVKRANNTWGGLWFLPDTLVQPCEPQVIFDEVVPEPIPITDNMIDRLDPGIRDLVVKLNALGYQTSDSGDGSKHATGDGAQSRHVFGVVPDGADPHAFARTLADRLPEPGKVQISITPDEPTMWLVLPTYEGAYAEPIATVEHYKIKLCGRTWRFQPDANEIMWCVSTGEAVSAAWILFEVDGDVVRAIDKSASGVDGLFESIERYVQAYGLPRTVGQPVVVQPCE